MEFKKEFERRKDLVESYLKKALPDKAMAQGKIFEAMEYSLLAGGKRIRPVLAVSVCAALGGDEEAALPFAAALEMIHTYSLIHDDLPCMDNDDLRRGRPTNHVVFGEGIATLAGDALLNYAFETAIEAKVPETMKIRALAVMGKAAGVYGMIGGQVIDLMGEERPLSADELTKMHDMKTGALIRAGAAIGCVAAGCDENMLDDYAKSLGLAFQLKDDILDETATTEELGKNAGSDIKNEKSTFIRLYGIEETRARLEAVTKTAIDSLSAIPNSDFLREFAYYLLKRKA